MKTTKKLVSILLALAMVLALATTAFAAETYSITINNDATGHIYEAYQILVGDLAKEADPDDAKDTEAVLSNVRWGASVANAAALGDATAYAEALAAGTKTVDDLIAEVVLGEKVADSGETTNPYVISGLAPGYYLVKDQDGSLNNKEDEAYTQYILEVVENSTLNPKSSVPEVEKKVKDINDSTDTEMSDWQDSADHDISDEVPFQLTATLAGNVESFKDDYMIVFHDTMSKGLTYKEITKVTVDGVEVTSGYDVATKVNEDGTTTLTITFADVTEQGAKNNSVVVVEYTATLNENAEVGATGNPNEVYLEYSNNPNWTGEGTPDTGKTPEDVVIVFTYKVVVNKTDENKNPLVGATFTLFKKTGVDAENKPVWTSVGEIEGNNLTTFEWTGLDDGDYKLEETVAPAGYNTIEPIEFTITAEHDILSDDPALTKLEGGDTFTGEISTGTLTGAVVNKAGATLPETGGIGTTLFYVIGGLLVVGAVVLLVTKKRMSTAA